MPPVAARAALTRFPPRLERPPRRLMRRGRNTQPGRMWPPHAHPFRLLLPLRTESPQRLLSAGAHAAVPATPPAPSPPPAAIPTAVTHHGSPPPGSAWAASASNSNASSSPPDIVRREFVRTSYEPPRQKAYCRFHETCPPAPASTRVRGCTGSRGQSCGACLERFFEPLTGAAAPAWELLRRQTCPKWPWRGAAVT